MKTLFFAVIVAVSTLLTGCAGSVHEVRPGRVHEVRAGGVPSYQAMQVAQATPVSQSAQAAPASRAVKIGGFTLWNPAIHSPLENRQDLKKAKPVKDHDFFYSSLDGSYQKSVNISSVRTDQPMFNSANGEVVHATTDSTSVNAFESKTPTPQYGWAGWGGTVPVLPTVPVVSGGMTPVISAPAAGAVVGPPTGRVVNPPSGAVFSHLRRP